MPIHIALISESLCASLQRFGKLMTQLMALHDGTHPPAAAAQHEKPISLSIPVVPQVQ